MPVFICFLQAVNGALSHLIIRNGELFIDISKLGRRTVYGMVSADYRKTMNDLQTSETMIQLAMIRLMI